MTRLENAVTTSAVRPLGETGEVLASKSTFDPRATGGEVRQLTEWMWAYRSGAFVGSPA